MYIIKPVAFEDEDSRGNFQNGSYGYINCTRSAAEQLFANAPGIQKLVDEEMYPKYMAQRGYTIPDYMK